MGEEADSEDCDMAAQDGDGDEGRVLEWEVGLPSADDLIPLSQSLISPDLAYAFSIVPEPARTLLDVHRASQRTVSSLRRNSTSSSAAAAALKFFSPFPSLSSVATDDPVVIDGEADDAENGITATVAATAGESSCLPPENSGDDHSNRALKRPRLVWTAQLHKRFIDVVAHLGIKNAVPKTIMQLMNVEGLTRENVASHLQKYRLYRKRMEGMSDEGLSSSDHFPHEPSAQMPTPYGAPPPTVPMSVFGIRFHPGHNGAMEMVPVVSHHQAPGVYRAFVSHHPNGEVIGDQQGDWSAGNKSGSIVSHPRAIPNDL